MIIHSGSTVLLVSINCDDAMTARAPESPRPPYPHSLHVDFYRLRLSWLNEQIGLLAILCCGTALDSQTPSLFHRTHSQATTGCRGPRDAIAFRQRPVGVTLAILLPIAATNVYCFDRTNPPPARKRRGRHWIFFFRQDTRIATRCSTTQTLQPNTPCWYLSHPVEHCLDRRRRTSRRCPAHSFDPHLWRIFPA